MPFDPADYSACAAAWTMDQATGATVLDASGHGYNGTPVNSPVSVAGKIGNALSFNGSNQCVDAGSAGNLTAALSVAAWVKISSRGGPANIVSKGFDGASTQWFLEEVDSSGGIFWGHYRGGSFGVSSNAVLPLNTWTHLVGTFDGTAWKIYINGSLDNSQNASGPTATGQKLEIGSVDNHGSPVQFFTGTIDEVRIYSWALSSAEVASLAAWGGGGGSSPLQMFRRRREGYERMRRESPVDAAWRLMRRAS